EQMLSHVWGYDFDPGSNVVDVYVRTLRRKIGQDRIVTVRGWDTAWTDPPAARVRRSSRVRPLPCSHERDTGRRRVPAAVVKGRRMRGDRDLRWETPDHVDRLDRLARNRPVPGRV